MKKTSYGLGLDSSMISGLKKVSSKKKPIISVDLISISLNKETPKEESLKEWIFSKQLPIVTTISKKDYVVKKSNLSRGLFLIIPISKATVSKYFFIMMNGVFATKIKISSVISGCSLGPTS